MKCNFTAPVPYSRKQIPVKIVEPTVTTVTEEVKVPSNNNTKGSNNNQKNNQNNQNRKNNNDIAAMKKPNANRKNQSAAEPAQVQTTHIVNIEPIGFEISTKSKEYS